MILLNQKAPVANHNKLPINLVFLRKNREVGESVDVTTKRREETDRKHISTLKKDSLNLKPQFKPSFNCLETLSKSSSDTDENDRELTNQSVG